MGGGEGAGSASATGEFRGTFEGKTLREKIRADRKHLQQSGGKLGSSYWADLRVKYSISGATRVTSDMLVVADKSEEVNPELHCALEQLGGGSNLTRKAVSRPCLFPFWGISLHIF